jgi:hypothetical protein
MVIAEIVNRRLTLALVWFAMALGAVYVYIFEPGKTGFFMICPFRALTGFACPGCGTTRALHHLLHGDVWGAFQLNPFTMVLVPILLIALLRHTIIVMRGQPVRGNQLAPEYIWLLFVVSLSFFIFRNTPWYPFIS